MQSFTTGTERWTCWSADVNEPETARQMCSYHNRELVLYEGVFVCDKCLAKYYGMRIHQPKQAQAEPTPL